MQRLKKIWTPTSILLHCYYDNDSDRLFITIKDSVTKKKTLYTLDHPKVPVYIVKPHIQINDYKDSEHISNLDLYWVPAKFKEGAIADLLGIKNYYQGVKEKRYNAKYIYLHKRLFGADKDVTDYVIADYAKHYIDTTQETPILRVPKIDSFHIGGLDIETDINVSDDQSQQPINVITYIDNESWVIRTIAVRNKEYKGQKEIEKNIEQFTKDLLATIRTNIENISFDGDTKKENEIKEMLLPIVDKLKLNLTFTNSEINMIRGINHYIFNEVNPDFLHIYNAQYDIGQQVSRAEKLGINIDNLFKYKDVPPCTAFNYKDTRYDVTKKIHTYNLANPTKIIDSMLMYYQFRSAKRFTKHSLDATAKREIGTSKLDYSKICNYIGDFPYVDYRSFLMYNIIDVLVMLMIDKVTRDTSTLVYRRFNLCTEWDKISKSKQRTTNAVDFYFNLQGYISSNETNALLLSLSDEMVEKMKATSPNLIPVIKQLREAKSLNEKETKTEKLAQGKEISDVADEDNPWRVPGGLVTSPSLISKSIKDSSLYGNINIKSYNKLTSCADDDASSMYPSNNIANNASKSTLYGVIKSVENLDIPNFSVKAAMSIINNNLSTVGNYFYGLPTADELLAKYKGIEVKYYNKYDNIKINKTDFKLDKISTDATKYISWWNSCYKTKYLNTDLQAGFPINSLILFSDNSTIDFSYYSTKVTVTLSTPINTLLGIEGQGFRCGLWKGNKLEFTNKFDEYLSTLRPKQDDPVLSELVDMGTLEVEDLMKVANSKYRTAKLQFGDYSLDFINRALFTTYKVPINWDLYHIDGNDDCMFLRLSSSYMITKELKVDVEQKIIFYNM